ncbi:hypothetical protein NIES2119_19235 [[Phormidium ambiguum] IAM M-71]|uniref:DUF305 domain-containing protein n=1 Tax=[Phormidium ambiguum] IAM M-71 TaxID=454136 RepID=A0A1U7IFX7_9CYAN|nr:DUF305 domain-containing protein [Phormidium ambiguum]OKH35874.1 hypothetical protein NIES2119_19235 [Phormidium ambiguum IAM M-71]
MLIPKRLLIALAFIGVSAASLTATQITNAGSASSNKQTNSSIPATGCPGMGGGMRGGMGMGMMHSMRVENEADFLSQMIPHHEEAIATAKLLKAGTNRPEMKKFADDIIRVQSAEIQQMQQWLKQWYPNQNTKVTYHAMMRDLTNLKGDDLDRAFLEDMRMHHKGAVMMSHQLLRNNLAKHNEVSKLAEQISISQRREIHQMQSWLRSWFNASGMGMMGRRNGRFGGRWL